MGESNGWGLRRYVTLFVVLMLHIALLATLVVTSRIRIISESTSHPIELLLIPRTTSPKLRAENSRPRHLGSDHVISITPPLLYSPSSASPAPPVSGSDGNGSGIDWAAEARRALQAFEIRSDLPPSNDSISVSPAEDNWWPRTAHAAGDKFKTPAGDWIVWISSNCYQVADSAPHADAPDAMPPRAVCVGDPRTRPDDPSDRPAAH